MATSVQTLGGDEDERGGSGVWAASAGVAAAWLAAGSTGLLAHSFRHSLTWLALAAAIVAGFPRLRLQSRQCLVDLAALIAAIAAAIAMTASDIPVVNVLAVTLVLAVLAALPSPVGGAPRRRTTLLLASTATAVLALYRLSCTSIPVVWHAADSLGEAIGTCGGLLSGRPLWVGATFAGLDFLVLMAVLYAGWLILSPAPRWPRALVASGCILAGHLAYLTVLSFAPAIRQALPPAPPPPPNALPWYQPPWSFTGGLRSLVPWNLPALAGLIHLTIAAVLLTRLGPLRSDTQVTPARPARWPALAAWAVAVLAAVALPVLTNLTWGRADLKGRKIVGYEKGFLNWMKPQHGPNVTDYGHLSVGMYGMLPTYIECMGGQFLRSAELSDEDLKGADVLLMMYPNTPWTKGQLDRIHAFARNGGSVLVFGEHTVRESDGGNRFNDVLAPTAMRVRFDAADFEVGGWLQSYEALAHPITSGTRDDCNQFGVVIGASMQAGWAARPVLIGRYGWADPGNVASPQAMLGNGQYDPGERLGDLVLAAEQPFGKGRIFAFGDTSSITNGINVSVSAFNSRLLTYLAAPDSLGNPQAPWRQGGGILAAVLLGAALAWRPHAWRTALAVLALAVATSVCVSASYASALTLPDGRGKTPNNLAYVDASHVERYSAEAWREDGTMGLFLNLMRDGYEAIMLPDETRGPVDALCHGDLFAQRLARAGVFISIAPTREFAPGERKALRSFVEKGGLFVLTVGYPESGSCRGVLDEFDFSLAQPDPAKPAPQTLGHFKSPYVDVDGYMAHVRFHAAWPVVSTAPGARPLAYGPGDIPVIMMREVGKGKVVVIGDTCFAMNKNLEQEGGYPFEGMRENADFWRWLLTAMTGQTPWLPSPPKPPATPAPANQEAPQ